MEGSKTPSKRMRDVIYILYSQKEGSVDLTKEEYYEKVMDVLINRLKKRIKPPNIEI